MNRHFLTAVLLFALCTGATSLFAMTDSERLCTRKTVEAAGKALIRIDGSMSVDVSSGGERRQDEKEFKSIVCCVTKNGYAIGSAINFNPDPYLEGKTENLNIKTTITKLNYVFEDGTTLPAEVVLEDKRTGWAVLRPVSDDGREFDCIDLSAVNDAAVLDEVVTVQKMDEKFKFAVAVECGFVAAKLKKPQTLYVLDGITPRVAHPVFNVSGKLIGFYAFKLSGADDAIVPVMLPEEVTELLKQTRDGAPEDAAGAKPKTRRELLEEKRAESEAGETDEEPQKTTVPALDEAFKVGE